MPKINVKKDLLILKVEDNETDTGTKPLLSNYNKKKFLKILKDINCCPDGEKELIKGVRNLNNAKPAKGLFKFVKHNSTL